MRKKLLATLVCVMLLVTLLPFAALAAGEQTVLDISMGNITIGNGTLSGYNPAGDPVTVPDPDGYTIIGSTTSYRITVNGGTHSITLSGVSIKTSVPYGACSFYISGGTVNLFLKGINEIIGDGYYAAIHVRETSEVIINGQSDGTGSLIAKGGLGGAGIGGSIDSDCGTVAINSGSVIATGSYGGAGIGGGSGYGGGVGGSGGHVTVNGGNVTATGGGGGAGIGGGGAFGGTGGSGGHVTINGGNVKATGDGGGADIGAGSGGNDNGTLTNGTVSVYRTILSLTGAAADTPIAGLNAGLYAYGMNGVKTLNGNKLYLYLPARTAVSDITTRETPARWFTNKSGTPITVAANHNNTGTLTETALPASPKTGDNSRPLLWLSVALMAGALLAADFVLRRRRQNG